MTWQLQQRHLREDHVPAACAHVLQERFQAVNGVQRDLKGRGRSGTGGGHPAWAPAHLRLPAEGAERLREAVLLAELQDEAHNTAHAVSRRGRGGAAARTHSCDSISSCPAMLARLSEPAATENRTYDISTT